MNILNKIIIRLLLLCYTFSITLGDAPIKVHPDNTVTFENVYIIRYSSTLTPKIILDRIENAGINYTHRFNLDFIDSVSIRFNENDVIKCSKIYGIENIWPVVCIIHMYYTTFNTFINILIHQLKLFFSEKI